MNDRPGAIKIVSSLLIDYEVMAMRPLGLGGRD